MLSLTELRHVAQVIDRRLAGARIERVVQPEPELRQAEIHLGYVDHMVAAGYRRLVDQLTERGVQVTVVED